MAERVGFEPTVRFPVRSLSRRVLSTAQSPLRGRSRLNRSRAVDFSAIGYTPWGAKTSGLEPFSTPTKSSRKKSQGNLLSARGEKRLDHGGDFCGENA